MTSTAEPPAADPHATEFENHRRALLGAAYRVLGTVQDSEDAVQETWLRWQAVDLDTVRNPRGYLVASVTRMALNVARSVTRRRENYIGPWLPEPVSTDVAADPGRAAEIADDVSLALLVVLESLSPLERGAFMLRTVFGTPYNEIARTLDRSEATVRQLVSRARTHVRDRAPRYPVDAAKHRAFTEAFLDATRGTAELSAVITHLAPDVLLTTDGGGQMNAALRPIQGTDKVLRFTAAILAKPEVRALAWTVGEVNRAPALVGYEGDRVDCVVWLEVDGELITRIDMIRNPDKLGSVRISAGSAG